MVFYFYWCTQGLHKYLALSEFLLFGQHFYVYFDRPTVSTDNIILTCLSETIAMNIQLHKSLKALFAHRAHTLASLIEDRTRVASHWICDTTRRTSMRPELQSCSMIKLRFVQEEAAVIIHLK